MMEDIVNINKDRVTQPHDRAGACGGVVQPHRGMSALMEVTGLSQPKVVVFLALRMDRCTAGLKSLL